MKKMIELWNKLSLAHRKAIKDVLFYFRILLITLSVTVILVLTSVYLGLTGMLVLIFFVFIPLVVYNISYSHNK